MQHRVAVAVLAIGLVACSPSDEPTTITVSAAASLTDAARDLVDEFTATHPGVRVELNLGGSATLVEQLVRGAPVDVLATADAATMDRAVDAGVVAGPVPFATNELVVAAPAARGRPSVDDLADGALLVGLCAPQVPCGAAAAVALADLGVQPRPDTEDGDVRTLLARLTAAELDVGVVYATDALAAGDALATTPLPSAITTLLVATTPGAPRAADDLVDLLRSPAGQAILREHGFGPPPGEAP